MSFFQRPHYTSDVTQFLQSLKAQHPELEHKQREGRSLLWDKRVDRALQAEFQAARVPPKAYPYVPEPSLR